MLKTVSKQSKQSKVSKLKLTCVKDIPLPHPSVKVKVTKDSFVLDTGHYECDIFTGHYKYEIPFKRCNTLSQVLKWIEHLSQKVWMSAKMLNTFIQLSLSRLPSCTLESK